jgi:hypothetical protein
VSEAVIFGTRTYKKEQETYEITIFALVFHRYDRLANLLLDLERPVFYVSLDIFIIEPTANEALGVKDGVFGVRMEGVFGAISDTERQINTIPLIFNQGQLTGVPRH